MLTVESRAALVAEFELFRGAEALLKAPGFVSLRDSYRNALEKVAAEKPIATNLTPLKYLVFVLMARELGQRKAGLDVDRLAEEIISVYVKTRDFMPPLLSAGFSREEAKAAERNAVLSLRQVVRQRRLMKQAKAPAASSGPGFGDLRITYGVTINDRPRREGAGTPKRKGTLGLQLRLSSQFVFAITNDNFSSKKRSDGTYITGIGNTTASLKYEALADPEKPTLNFTYSITLPTASVAKALGTGRVDHKIIGDMGKKVRDTQLGLSLGYLFSGRKDKHSYSTTGLAAIFLDHPLGKGFTSKNEIDFATRADLNPSEVFAINQLVYKVNDTISLRAGVRTGITPYTPRIGFTTGITISSTLQTIFK